MIEKAHVLYHANCFDGTMAAAIFECANQSRGRVFDAEYQKFDYDRDIGGVEKFRDKYLFVLDMTLPTEVLNEIATVAKSVIVIDHHPKAREQASAKREAPGSFADNVQFVTDSDIFRQSGAQLTWNYFFFGAETQPNVVRWVGKSDLFLFDEPEVRPFRRGLGTLGLNPSVWMTTLLLDPDGEKKVLEKGTIISDVIEKQLDYLEEHACSRMMIAGYNVISVDAPYFLASEIAERIYTKTPAELSPFVAVHYEQDGRLKYSLRSRQDSNVNLEEVAKQFGGSGHFHAAGFRVNIHKSPLGPRQAVPEPVKTQPNFFERLLSKIGLY